MRLRADPRAGAVLADAGNEAAAGHPDDARARRRGTDSGRRGRRDPWRRAFIVALVLATVVVVAWSLLGSSLTVVRQVKVTGAGPLVPAAAVVSAAAIPPRTPLARLDTAAAARRVERLTPVLTARVTRSFPDTVVIAVQQRTPVLAVAVPGGYHLIDEYGVTVTSAGSEPPGMPLLVGPPPARGSRAVRTAALVVRGLPAWLRSLVMSVSATGSVTLQLSGGITVTWGGPGQAAEKAAELEVLLRTGARAFDLSDPATAVTGQ